MPIDEWMHYVDKIERQCMDGNPVLLEIKTTHKFVNGIYIRQVTMPAGSMIISRIHISEHPFAILQGEIDVRTHKGISKLNAPYVGVTMPMTRRILYAVSDCVWATFHVMEKPNETVDEILDRIISKRRNPLLTDQEIRMIEEKVLTTNQLN